MHGPQSWCITRSVLPPPTRILPDFFSFMEGLSLPSAASPAFSFGFPIPLLLNTHTGIPSSALRDRKQYFSPNILKSSDQSEKCSILECRKWGILHRHGYHKKGSTKFDPPLDNQKKDLRVVFFTIRPKQFHDIPASICHIQKSFKVNRISNRIMPVQLNNAIEKGHYPL